ncbi:MAG: FAD-linked oxidase C-terminal domain-containing protein, partial [Gemmatimonadota bacterium]
AIAPYLAAAIQFEPVLGDREGNIEALLRLCEEAAASGAKLIVLPEMATTGYCWQDREEVAPFVETIPGPTTEVFTAFCARHDCWIVAGMAEVVEETGVYYNSAALIGPEGVAGIYRKTHAFISEPKWAKDGDLGLPVFATPLGRIGIAICMDAAYPETTRIPALRGADIIAFPTNWLSEKAPSPSWWARAVESGVYLIAANRYGVERGVQFDGGSCIIEPDGAIHAALDRGDGTGYDLLGAFVGSEGCFGVVLDVTVRLTPIPEGVITLLADFTSVRAAADATSRIIAAGILPAALELMDHATIEAVESSVYAAGYPRDAAAVLLAEVDGAVAGLDADAEAIERLCCEAGAREVRVARDAVERARLWQGRKKAFGAMGRVAPHLVVQDAVVPRTKLADLLEEIHAIGMRHDVRVCNVFHAGDGNLHPNIPYDADDPAESARVAEAMSEIMHRCIAVGGTITGEHGVGLDKLDYMPALFGADTLDAMCTLRDVFDPDRRANPGKVVPVRSCREWLAAPSARTH